ncbi:cGMP-specific 3',5'-cyclic phosphodiesterase [Octopus bimaculoides]|uniref:Phosphodiesterase n=1 Tax=Octopus bimaculoides TaxID=37653 RepID=A0A0L8GBS2_OCTBM|nr:cGMP-specific 3',5'-cyclic phosphodiesterase [Octopus bimaculoides]|eukprot:XP_014782381.1 PREDICTED: cGMP-specific 3',5'-cyclic phosphodiesterase-like [Octopus bimaculoides]
MVDPICADDVEKFLEENPEFTKNWISKHNANTSEEKVVVVPSLRHSFIDCVKMIISRNSSIGVNKNTVLTVKDTYREIMKELASELNEDKLCYAVLQNTCILIQSNSASIYLARGTGKTRYLISKYVDVTATSDRNETLHSEPNIIRIPFGEGILGYVAESKRSLNIKDVTRPHHSLSDDKSIGLQVQSILCMPILNKYDNVMGVVNVQNSKENANFSLEDEALFENLLSVCGISIENAHLFQVCLEEFKRHQLLLKLANCILKEQNNLPKLISQILHHAMALIDSSNISIYLTDSNKETVGPNINSKVFQLLKEEKEAKEVTIDRKFIKPVENNLKSENVFDVFNLKFSSEISFPNLKDSEMWLLGMPIKDSTGNTIGCIMFVRDSVDDFSENDIKMMKAFTTYCGLSIFNCRLYESSVKLLSRAKIIDDVIAYNKTCDQKTIDRYLSMEMKSSEHYQIYNFHFDDSLYTDDDTVLICARLLLKLDVVNVLNISMAYLYRFIVTVKDSYRPVTYHNWRHVLNVTQSMFCMLTTGKLETYFTKFQMICLLIACLLHDLEHRGQNNSFQVRIASSLATLYSTSILEHYHISRNMMILNKSGTNIFKNLPVEKYREGFRLIEKAIFATDLKNHFENRSIFRHEIESDHRTFDSLESIDLLIGMVMTAADLSAATKPWEIQRKTAIKVISEYFEQGELDKALKSQVLSLVDREKKCEITRAQVDFIDFVCMPIYKLLVKLETCLRPLYDGCIANGTHWRLIAADKEKFNIDEELIVASHQRLRVDQPKQHQEFRSSSMDIQTRNNKILEPILDKFRSPIALNLITEHNSSVWCHSEPSLIPKLKKLTMLKSPISACPWQESIVKFTMAVPHKKVEMKEKSCQTDMSVVKLHTRNTVQIYNSKGKITSEGPMKVSLPVKTTYSATVHSDINEFATNKHSNSNATSMQHQNYIPTLALSPNSLRTSIDVKTFIKHTDSTHLFDNVEQVVTDDIYRVSEKLNRKIGQNLTVSDSISTVNEYNEAPTVEYDFTPNINQFRKRKCLKKIPVNMKDEQDILKSYLCVIS